MNLKSTLSKLNFRLGRNPVIEKAADCSVFIPEPYQSVFTLSSDFELAWAWRFAKKERDPIRFALQKAKLARKNMPNILRFCEEYNVPVTWATVGHLFLKSCEKENGIPHPDMKRMPHFDNGYWDFNQGDWYRDDPCTNYKDGPEWYAPDLLDQIQKSPTAHEIACHTFSHIDCSNIICPPEVFRSELEKCIEVAADRNISLKTFIYPAHTVGNLDELVKLGFTNFRSNLKDTLGYPVLHKNGLWEIKSSFHLMLRKEWSYKYQIYRAKEIIDRAIKHKTVCHFWFHPSFPEAYLMEVFPEVLSYLDSKRDEILLTTTDRYVDWLNEGHVKAEEAKG